MDIRQNINLGIFHFLLIDENIYYSYYFYSQMVLIFLFLILMVLANIFIIVSYCWNTSKIKRKGIYNLFFHHNITFVTLVYVVDYLISSYLLITIIKYLVFKRIDEYSINFIIFWILFIWVFLIMPTKIAMEIFFDLLRFYIKKLFSFDQEINCLEWHFVGLKNEPKALLYYMLNSWRKIIYLIPIYMIFMPILIFEDYNINVIYVLAFVIISLIEVAWLVYICKVYPYDSLSHNRIIIINQISVVFILTLCVITIKNKFVKIKFITC